MKIIYSVFIIAPLLFAIQGSAENDYKQQIMGRWKFIGFNCDREGNCTDTFSDKGWIEFMPDGTYLDFNNGTITNSVFKITDNIITITDSDARTYSPFILILNKNTLLLHDQKNDKILKLKRSDEYENRTEKMIEPAERKFTKKIIGRWRVTGEECNNAEDCKKNETEYLWVEFSKAGKCRAKQYDGNIDDTMSYRIENDIIICTSQHGDIKSKILLLDNTTLILQDIAGEIIKFTRAEKNRDTDK